MSTTGAGLKRLLANASQPAPCASGSIVFVRNGDLYVLSTSHQTVKRITFRGGVDPSCAPNSRRVAFIRGKGLYTLGIDGKQLKFVAVGYNGPAYSPEGSLIAYIIPHDLARGYSQDVDTVDVQRHHHRKVKSVAVTFFSDEAPANYGFAAGTAWQPNP